MMTETMTERGTCAVGRSTDTPCPYPATVEMPDYLPEGVGLCADHAAIRPLAEESDEMHIALEMLEGYLKAARKAQNAALLTVLERAKADFTERRARVDKEPEDLREADLKLIRR